MRKYPITSLIVILFLVIGGLAALDLSLEDAQRTELRNEAEDLYREGSRLLAAGKAREATEVLRRAHMLERQDQKYELELVSALAASSKPDEATPLLEEALDREPNDGRTNLIAARLMLQKGNTPSAESYFHRAIYGNWLSAPASHKVAARLELIELLAKTNRKEELLAELLPLQQDASKNPELQMRLAHLFLVAGSPARGADAFQKLIHQDPHNVNAYVGLGEADLQQSQYHPAVTAFLQAYRRKPGDPSIRQRLEFAGRMAGLDPTVRQLSSSEKYARSERILDMARASLAQCTGRPDVSLPGKTPTHVTNEMAEAKLAQATQVWQERLSACGPSTSGEEEALRLTMAKVSQ